MPEIAGNNDKGLSPFLKAYIKPSGSDVMVVGVIGPGSSRQLQANWNSPFEQASVGSMFEKTGGLIQQATGRTAVTLLNSEQIWEGNRPLSFTLNLLFYALSDASKEVMLPLALLEKWASPEVNAMSPLGVEWVEGGLNADFGRMPPKVTINMGRKTILTSCVIESISTPTDKERGPDGSLIRAEVNLQIGTKSMLNASQILPSWGIG
jgi:hypothetical protein